MILFAEPSLPYILSNTAMATSPNGGGVILFGGYNLDENAQVDTLLELRYRSYRWNTLPQKLTHPRSGHVVILISEIRRKNSI